MIFKLLIDIESMFQYLQTTWLMQRHWLRRRGNWRPGLRLRRPSRRWAGTLFLSFSPYLYHSEEPARMGIICMEALKTCLSIHSKQRSALNFLCNNVSTEIFQLYTRASAWLAGFMFSIPSQGKMVILFVKGHWT